MAKLVPSQLAKELQQQKPFESPEQEAVLSIARTAAMLDRALTEFLKPHGVTPTQYNVLRILRGAGENALCRHEIRERLVSEVPDVTRLLDRLEDAGLVRRTRDPEDRRMTRTRITARGRKLLASLDEPLRQLQEDLLGEVARVDLVRLVDLLATVRRSL